MQYHAHIPKHIKKKKDDRILKLDISVPANSSSQVFTAAWRSAQIFLSLETAKRQVCFFFVVVLNPITAMMSLENE